MGWSRNRSAIPRSPVVEGAIRTDGRTGCYGASVVYSAARYAVVNKPTQCP